MYTLNASNDSYHNRHINMEEKYEAVIGLEVHAELKTESKIFCACRADFGNEPNENVCPTCLGMPGTLPILNKQAVVLAVRAGLAFDCRVSEISRFDRKNYFYPDLPKGYQITQYFSPICLGGAVPIRVDGVHKAVRLTRIHLEEDAGKLIHRGGQSLLDYNRAGLGLIEIVSEPDMHSAAEAMAYLNALRRILAYYGVSDCKMNEGSLRCDVNVSVRLRGEEEFGIKCEIKNLNSVHFVGKAIEDEITRQIALIENGEAVEAETRRYNEDTGHTERMRKKEAVVDYRYFPEPNLPPLRVSARDVERIRKEMPPMPDCAAAELTRDYDVKTEDAYALTAHPRICRFFKDCMNSTRYRQPCANLFLSEVLPLMWVDGAYAEGAQCVRAEYFGQICDLFGEGKIVSGTAKKLIAMSAESGESPLAIAEREKLLKIVDPQVLMPWIHAAAEQNPKAIADYKGGKKTAVRQLIGFVMRESGGRADPILTEKLLTETLESL